MPLGYLIRSTWIDKVIQLAGCDLQRTFQTAKKFPVDIHLGDSSVLYQPGPEDSDIFNYTIILNMADVRQRLGHSDNLEPSETVAEAKPLPLWRLCWRNRSAVATDARDKIHAYVGLSKEFLGPKQHEWTHLSPDYTKPASQVYTEASQKMISSMGNLRFLSLRESQLSTNLADLPSWVPDFSAHGWPYPFDTGGPTPWTTSFGLASHIDFSQKGVLQVRGFKIGEVTRCASPGFHCGFFSEYASLLTCIPDISQIRDPVINEHLRKYLQEGDAGVWEKAFDHLGQPDNAHAQGEIRTQYKVEVLWRTALTDRFAGLHPAPAEYGVVFDSLITSHLKHAESHALAARAKRTRLWPLIEESFRRNKTHNISALSEMLDGISSFEDAKYRLRTEYTACRKLQGLVPFDSIEILYPPAFVNLEEDIDRAVSEGKGRAFQLIMDNWSSLREKAGDSGGEPRMQKMRSEMMLESMQLLTARRLFATDRGHLAAGVETMEIGDEVWVLAGASVPFLLRRRQERGRYSLLGEAYVHGIMHGEAVDVFLGSSESVQTISII